MTEKEKFAMELWDRLLAWIKDDIEFGGLRGRILKSSLESHPSKLQQRG